jgi:hypothetical protein
MLSPRPRKFKYVTLVACSVWTVSAPSVSAVSIRAATLVLLGLSDYYTTTTTMAQIYYLEVLLFRRVTVWMLY